MKTIRAMVFPWILFFMVSVGGFVELGLRFPGQLKFQQMYLVAVGLGTLLCLMSNVRSLGKVGIWMSESLPESLRYGSGRWFYRAFLAGIITGLFWASSKLPWTPLFWQGAIVPFVYTVTLFVVVWNLLGPVLKWSSNMAWSRFFSLIFSLPIIAAVPLGSIFVGRIVLAAFQSSKANVMIPDPQAGAAPEQVHFHGKVLSVVGNSMRVYGEWPSNSGQSKTLDIQVSGITPTSLSALPKDPTKKEVTLTLEPEAVRETDIQAQPNALDAKDIHAKLHSGKESARATAFREIFEFSNSCGEYTKEIQGALDPKGPQSVVYWAARDVECAEVKSSVALPRLVDLMTSHGDALVRAAAVRSMKKYGHENLRQIAYLLIKRISEKEPGEVIAAVANLMAPLGGDQVRWATNHLKPLLDSKTVASSAAASLIDDYGRADLVAEYVDKHLGGDEDSRNRAVSMVCLLPKASRNVAEAHIEQILSSMKTGDASETGFKALSCLGKPGFQAIRNELSKPDKLSKAVSARALAQMNVSQYPEALELAGQCAKDEDPNVSRWCSQALGQLGAPALPTILEMLKSGDVAQKEAGKNALHFFEDPRAKEDLEKIVRDNSGWMANNRKLQVAKAIGSALVKIQSKPSNGGSGDENSSAD